MATKFLDTSLAVHGDGLASTVATQAYQECGLSGKSAGDETGLSHSTTYYYKHNINGAGVAEKSITVAGDSTFGAVIALMNAVSGASVILTWALVGGDLRCTTVAGGVTTSVALSAGTTGTNLFATLTGFSSFDVAVAGTSGAWNNFALTLAGSNLAINGNVAAGDLVHVRCGASGTTTVTINSALTTNTTATQAAPIWWVFGDTSVWVGDTGSLDVVLGVNNTYIWTFNNWNHFKSIGNKTNFKVSATGSAIYVFSFNNCIFDNIGFYSTDQGSNSKIQWFQTANTIEVIFKNCYFFLGTCLTAYQVFSLSISGISSVVFESCEFDVKSQNAGQLFIGGYGTSVTLLNCKLTRMTANWAVAMWTASNTFNQYTLIGTDLGSTPMFAGMDAVPPTGATLTGNTSNQAYASNMSGTNYSSLHVNNFGSAQWRSDGNYPVLQAMLPDGSNTTWSWRVFPNGCGIAKPYKLPPISKIYTGTAATKTITVEMLINNSYGTLTTNDWWMDVYYTDNSTGLVVRETTGTMPLTANNLSTSTANWSTTTYGALSYSKFKIALTTANSIKPNTEVIIILKTSKRATLATDFDFIDPDPQFT